MIIFPTIKVGSLFSNPWKLFEEVDTFGGLGIGAPQLIQKLRKTQQAMGNSQSSINSWVKESKYMPFVH